MPTKKAEFMPIVLGIINSNEGLLHIQDIYQKALAEIVIDSEDLLSPIAHGKKTSDVEWKKEIRLALRELVSKGDICTPKLKHYSSPISDESYTPLSWELVWENILHNAGKYLANGTDISSKIQERSYKVKEITAKRDKISITRIQTNSFEKITKAHIQKGIQNLNSCGGKVARRTVHYTVAIESAIVELSDHLQYDQLHDYIMVTNDTSVQALANHEEIFYESIPNGSKTPHKSKPTTYMKVERDSKMIAKLKQLYSNSCQMCGTVIRLNGNSDYSEGAHVIPLSKGGQDVKENVLILCPNHHVLLDHGNVKFTEEGGWHSINQSGYLRFKGGHFISKSSLEFHGITPKKSLFDY
jgi:predicted HNH restriction endonuclease